MQNNGPGIFQHEATLFSWKHHSLIITDNYKQLPHDITQRFVLLHKVVDINFKSAALWGKKISESSACTKFGVKLMWDEGSWVSLCYTHDLGIRRPSICSNIFSKATEANWTQTVYIDSLGICKMVLVIWPKWPPRTLYPALNSSPEQHGQCPWDLVCNSADSGQMFVSVLTMGWHFYLHNIRVWFCVLMH